MEIRARAREFIMKSFNIYFRNFSSTQQRGRRSCGRTLSSKLTSWTSRKKKSSERNIRHVFGRQPTHRREEEKKMCVRSHQQMRAVRRTAGLVLVFSGKLDEKWQRQGKFMDHLVIYCLLIWTFSEIQIWYLCWNNISFGVWSHEMAHWRWWGFVEAISMKVDNWHCVIPPWWFTAERISLSVRLHVKYRWEIPFSFPWR